MTGFPAATLELDDVLRPLNDLRRLGTLPEVDRFLFAEQGVTDPQRVARLRCVALYLELTASHLRRVTGETG